MNYCMALFVFLPVLLWSCADSAAPETSGNTGKEDRRIYDLARAIEAGDLDTVKALLENGLDVNLWYSCQGCTPLLLAVYENQTEIAVYLMEQGADVSVFSTEYLGRVICGTYNYSYPTGHTPLMLACVNENMELVRLLMAKGADINAADSHGNTAFLYALPRGTGGLFESNVHTADLELLSFLIDQGADIACNRCKALRCAAGDRLETVLFLEEQGLDFSKVSGTGVNGLMISARENKLDIAGYLLRYYDINAPDSRGYTPLFYALFFSNTMQMVRFLLENGADVNARDKEGLTPLGFAEKRNYDNRYADVIDMLIDAGGVE